MRIFLLSLLLIGCTPSNIIEIKDASIDTTVFIKTKSYYPALLHLNIKGETKDSFIINDFIIPGGIVDTTLIYDWYVDSFSLKYKAYKLNKGALKIKYKL